MSDFQYFSLWWAALFGIGIIFLPITSLLFSSFFDRGYIFSKTIGIAVLSYFIFIAGLLKILPFTTVSIYVSLVAALITNFFILQNSNLKSILFGKWKIFLLEELLFFASLAAYVYVRGHEPSIKGLEKFMDFGFINSILRAEYFPPRDMWFPPYSINYYYFGHLMTAYLIRLTQIPSFIGFNLMLGTVFALSMVSSFSLGASVAGREIGKKGRIAVGILAAFLINLAGNLQTIYSLFTPYKSDNPMPPWQLLFSPSTFPNSYWYANATRFIPFTIHEFPSYSYVVADLHAHVLDIPFVLLSLALLWVLFQEKEEAAQTRLIPRWSQFYRFRPTIFTVKLSFFSFILAIMYMTNAWDGAVYLLAAIAIFTGKKLKFLAIKKTGKKIFAIKLLKIKNFWILVADIVKKILISLLGLIVFSLPFTINFQSGAIVKGIGILCAPSWLIKIGKIGPFLFEANHCQRSFWWQLMILYGFFYFFVIVFLLFLKTGYKKLTNSSKFILCLIFVSTLLIVIPEFAYLKDIYPQHYRANTMFKLVYQSFIMLSLSCAYIIYNLLKSKKRVIFLPIIGLFFIPIFIFPYFAFQSYYQFPPNIVPPCSQYLNPICAFSILQKNILADISNYKGLDGLAYLKNQNVEDYAAINWMNQNITGQPIIVEAQGDSYTDYERISANTGLPTILGWTVHEWLWRGSYDIPAPRIEEVKTIYETADPQVAAYILQKYKTRFVYVGSLERQKYPNLSEDKFKLLGKVVFEKNNSRLYKLR